MFVTRALKSRPQ